MHKRPSSPIQSELSLSPAVPRRPPRPSPRPTAPAVSGRFPRPRPAVGNWPTGLPSQPLPSGHMCTPKLVSRCSPLALSVLWRSLRRRLSSRLAGAPAASPPAGCQPPLHRTLTHSALCLPYAIGCVIILISAAPSICDEGGVTRRGLRPPSGRAQPIPLAHFA